LSADDAKRLKPAKEAYERAAKLVGVPIADVRLIAAHDWDVAGALRAGASAAFVARPGTIWNELVERPDVWGVDLEDGAEPNIASAFLIGSIPVAAWLGALTMAQLYVVGYLVGAAGQANDLARQALMPPLIGRDRLVEANSQMQVSGAITQIAGPSLGGILVQ